MKQLRTVPSVSTTLVAIAAATWACAPAGGGTAEGEAASTDARATSPQVVTSPARRPPRGTAWVIFGTDTVVAEVARTEAQREVGLMGRESIPDGTGMLFMWERPEQRSFWMKDTFVALDIGFMDANYRVFDIQQMEPMSLDPHESSGPGLFALEVPGGWFAAHGVVEGDVAEIVFGP
jgi:uncharacterized membrane protein (UPF0127 family)